MAFRIATFNVENLDEGPGTSVPLGNRIPIVRAQLERLRADILCLQEVWAQGASGSRTFSALNQLLQGTQYAGFGLATTRTLGGEPYRRRNIVTLSRFPFVGNPELIRASDAARPSYQMATANPPDAAADPLLWERPLLYTKIQVAPGKVLHVINAHFKSKNPTSIPGRVADYAWTSVSAWAEGSFISSMKRVAQALQVRMRIDQIFADEGADALVAICGDLNAEAGEVPLRAICGHVEETGNPDHAQLLMVPCENHIPDSARYSLLHLGRRNMLDHILVSRSLLRYLCDAQVHNEALPDESGAFRTDEKFPESDHAPVLAEFEMD
jgi:predicted extracellular nuclease